MTITVSFRRKHENREVNIMVDSGQKIEATLKALTEAGIFPEEKYRIRSARTDRRLKSDESYEDSRIYNGDILILDK